MLQTFVLKTNLVFILFIICVQVVAVIGNSYSFLKSEDCECYMLGTIGSIDGKSLCNTKSLQCKCHPNVMGKNCDQCMVGYYNILSGYGCFPCNCNPTGSIKNVCDKHTGECLCKPGYIGSKCDQCDFHKYQTSTQKCETMNCTLLHCSNTHQCNKMENLIQTNIEEKYCMENFDVLQGCSASSACYNTVEDTYKQYEDYFNFTINIITDKFPFYLSKYQLFVSQVLDLKMLVENLKLKCEQDINYFEIDVLTNILVQETEYFRDEILSIIRVALEIFDNNTIQQHQENINVGLTELQDLIYENKILLENSTIISKTMSKHNKKMTSMSKEALKILNNIEKKVENNSFITKNTLQVCNETCKLNATYFNIYIQLHYKLLALQDDTSRANKRMKAMRDYMESLHDTTNFTRHVTENLKSEVIQTKLFSTNIIFNEFYMTVKNFSKINISLQHMNQEHDTFKEKQNLFNKIWNYAQVKEDEINNGLIKLNYYKNRSDEIIDKFDIFKLSVEVVQLNFKELENLNERIFNIQDQTTAVLNGFEEIRNLFTNMTATVKYIDDIQHNLLDISKSMLNNQGNMELTSESINELEQRQFQNSLKLTEYQEQINNIKKELDLTTKSQNKYEKNLKRMKEYLIVLNYIPTSPEQLDKIESDIEAMEEVISRVDYLNRLLHQKEHLKQQVKNIVTIIESLPDEDGTLCEAAQTEPKLNLN